MMWVTVCSPMRSESDLYIGLHIAQNSGYSPSADNLLRNTSCQARLNTLKMSTATTSDYLKLQRFIRYINNSSVQFSCPIESRIGAEVWNDLPNRQGVSGWSAVTSNKNVDHHQQNVDIVCGYVFLTLTSIFPSLRHTRSEIRSSAQTFNRILYIPPGLCQPVTISSVELSKNMSNAHLIELNRKLFGWYLFDEEWHFRQWCKVEIASNCFKKRLALKTFQRRVSFSYLDGLRNKCLYNSKPPY